MTRRRTLTGIKFLGNSKPCMMCGGHRCDIRASSQAAAPAPDLKRCNILFPVVAEVSNRVKGRALAPPHSDTERLSDRAQGEEYRTAFKSGESALSPRCLALQTKAEVIIGIRKSNPVWMMYAVSNVHSHIWRYRALLVLFS